MEALFTSGRIIDITLLIVAIEALGLILWRRRVGWPLPLLCNLTSGAALMLALRAALIGAHWTTLAGCLAVSGLAHATEMVLRLAAESDRKPHAPARLDPHA